MSRYAGWKRGPALSPVLCLWKWPGGASLWFLCPYGKPPGYYFFKPIKPLVNVNTRQLQNIHSNICAYYCFVVAFLTLKGNAWEHILSKFSDNLLNNDASALLWADMIYKRVRKPLWETSDNSTHGRFCDAKSMHTTIIDNMSVIKSVTSLLLPCNIDVYFMNLCVKVSPIFFLNRFIQGRLCKSEYMRFTTQEKLQPAPSEKFMQIIQTLRQMTLSNEE